MTAERTTRPPARPEIREPRRLPENPTADHIAAWLLDTLADRMEVPPARIDASREFATIGIDSITALNITGELAEATGTDLHQTLFWDYPDIPSLSRYVAMLLGGRTRERAQCGQWDERAAQAGLSKRCISELRQRLETWIDVVKCGEGMLISRLREESGTGTAVFWVGGLMRSQHIARMLGSRPFHILPTGLGIVDGTREEISALAEYYCEEILFVQPKGPYILGGYCFGAAIALEIARELTRRGGKVACLVVMEWPGPAPAYRRWYDLVGPLFSTRTRHDARRAGRLLRERRLRDAFGILKRKLGGRPEPVRTGPGAGDPANGGEPAPQALITRLEVPRQARWKYTPKPVRVPTIVLTGRQSALHSVLFPRIGWEDVLKGPSRYVAVPGDHFSMLKGNGAKAIKRVLSLRFRRIDRQGRGEPRR